MLFDETLLPRVFSDIKENFCHSSPIILFLVPCLKISTVNSHFHLKLYVLWSFYSPQEMQENFIRALLEKQEFIAN